MGDWNGTVPTILAGDIPTGDDWGNVLDELTAVSAAWTSYTPAWTASAGTPDISNGSLTGKYRRVGKTVDFKIELTAGSSTTYGTAGAYWKFSLPGSTTVSGKWSGTAVAIDTGVLEYSAIWVIGYESSSLLVLLKPVSGRFVNNSPFTFGNTDILEINGTYESV